MNFDHLQGQVDDTVDGEGEKDNKDGDENENGDEKDNNNDDDENILDKPQNDDESFKLDKNDFKFKYGFYPTNDEDNFRTTNINMGKYKNKYQDNRAQHTQYIWEKLYDNNY